MNTSNSNQNTLTPRQVKINRLKLIAIFGVAVVPVVLAVVMYFGGWAVPDAKTNKGNLVWPPVSLLDLAAQQSSSEFRQLSEDIEADDQWVLLITGKSECQNDCSELIHTVRQVHVAMGREVDRLTHWSASDLPEERLAALRSEYPEMKHYALSPASLDELQKRAISNGAISNGSEWTVWVVDPLGNLILQYTSEQDGYDLKDDLKKLLKLSNIG